MKCRFCSSMLAADMAVCPHCGHRLFSPRISDFTVVLLGLLLLMSGGAILALEFGGFVPPLRSLTLFAALLILSALWFVVLRRR